MKYLQTFRKRLIRLAFLSFCFFLFSCAFPQRPGYDRDIGDYPQSKYNEKIEKIAEVEQSTEKPSEKINTPTPPVVKSSNALEEAIKPWLGTPYRYGGQSKNGTDCSGFVRQIYKSHFQTDLPHSTKASWTFGKAISMGDLEPGDVVFFGNFIGVSHNGIFVGNRTFAHSSSSKGVMYESLDSEYWADRYQGARRYIW